MIIGSVTLERRSNEGIVEEPQRWYSAGLSEAADVSRLDFGHKQQDVTIVFATLTEALKNSLKSYLMDTAGQFGTVSVTPDTGDDLGIGATEAVYLTFISFQAKRVAYNIWHVTCNFRYYT